MHCVFCLTATEDTVLDDLTKTVKAQLYERASSPLLASFALAWIAWNYRFIIVLISSMAAHEKFQYIDNHLYQGYWEIALRGALYPLITSLLLIFVYPIPAKYVYEYWRKRHRELKEIQQRIDDETPLTKEDAREIRREAMKATSEYELELERRNSEVVRLKDLINDLERRLIDATSTPSPVEPKPQDQPDPAINPNQIDMLKRVAESATPLLEKTLISSMGSDRVLAEYNLGELEKRGLVSKSYSGARRDSLIKATHSGRTYLVSLLHDDSADSTSPPT